MIILNITSPDKSLEEKTDELGSGFNKLNNKLSNLLEESQNLQQLIVNLENQENDEIQLINKKFDDLRIKYLQRVKKNQTLNDENEHLKKWSTMLNDEN